MTITDSSGLSRTLPGRESGPVSSPQGPLELQPSSSLDALQGVGPRRSEALHEAGFQTALDLLSHLPMRYEDRRRRTRISAIETPGQVLLRGRISELSRVRIRRRGMSLVRGRVSDETGSLPALWFNRPYLLNQVDEDVEYLLFGSVRQGRSGLELLNATCEPAATARLAGRIVPVYGAIESLSPTFVGSLIRQILERADLDELEDPVPDAWLTKHRLPTLSNALTRLHRPPEDSSVELLNARATPWHQRLAYGEFLELQLEMALMRGLQVDQPKSHRYRMLDSTRQRMLDILPFELTGAQRRSIDEIVRDLEQEGPMLRLLQGDVGSGKTIVAAMSIVAALESGLQAAMMAPTEILAEQHHRTLAGLLGDRYRIALLTKSTLDPDRVRHDLAEGSIQLLVGTHALIQEQIEFQRLGLAIIDEQHRFGVAQRSRLQQKGDRPDVLVMTATPIPRSLALTVYGDLALSIIDELPPGRRPVSTSILPIKKRVSVYKRLRQVLVEGAQAYVVVPLVKESASVEAESIATATSLLQRHLEGFEIGVVHGALDSDTRERVMEAFLDGTIDVLLATSVIEVGVDVANASIMVVENVERFGLAQLHQLRGRVGRGERPSFCIGLHARLSDEARRRLEVFAETSDGFVIAEADLEIRGPGDLLGEQQSGTARFRVGDLVRDQEWLERARRDAQQLVKDPSSSPLKSKYLDRLARQARERYVRMNAG